MSVSAVPRAAGTTSASVRRTDSLAKKDPVRKVIHSLIRYNYLVFGQ